jgi:hypothetical protein
MRSEKDVLPGEDGALYEERRAAFHRVLAPRDEVQEALVDRFARLEWRGQRGEAVEEARAELKIHDAVEGAECRDAAEAARLAAHLIECPENVWQLLRMPAGVRLMIQTWSVLRADVVKHTNILGTQRQRCLALVGKRREDVLRDDPIALRWMRAQIGMVYGTAATPEQVARMLGGEPPEGMSHAEFDLRVERMVRSLPSKAEAHAQLIASIDEEIRRLEDQLQVVEPLAERNRALAAKAARAEVTAEGARLGQQILASYRGSDAALRRLEALQNPRQPGPGRGPKKAEPAPAAPAPAPQDAPTIVASDDAAGDEPGVPTPTPGPAGDPAPSAATGPDPAGSAPRADEAILAGESSPAPAAGAVALGPASTPQVPERTTEDVPIPELTPEELERDCPELAAFQWLQQSIEATYGTVPGARLGQGEAPSEPHTSGSAGASPSRRMGQSVTYGPGGTAGKAASCRPSAAAFSGSDPRSAPGPDPPSGRRADTVEAILGGAPPSDPAPRALGRAPPGE